MANDIETAKQKLWDMLASDVAAYDVSPDGGTRVQLRDPLAHAKALVAAQGLAIPTATQSATTYAEVIT